MIRLCFVCFLLLGSSGLLAYSALTGLFQTGYAGTTRLGWKAPSDSDKQQYAVLRKATISPAFHMLASLEPTNQSQYEYRGQSTYHGLSSPFSHRLEVRPKARQEPFQTSPDSTPGAVERSWSTIKSMFR
ncbi:hypothetical protein SAMN06265337_2820 [Hymenobacter gelipurpurascens]|uniref:Secreted protein n=1 Tax=Hymenobacter gelipurpurascens TaxID=89968 RepID=A0A212UAZ6_9BACT|nr:hypothetical protein [Hymenobacter gelipurpurascens]SNC75330.1 hypothetical protein SAMN06265337_2820 [Hymenobacter gelipurpurascens]